MTKTKEVKVKETKVKKTKVKKTSTKKVSLKMNKDQKRLAILLPIFLML